MRKTLTIAFLVLAFFAAEYVLYNFLGRWFKPNFSIVLIVFFNFYWGTRYGVVTAVLSGILKDSFSASFFGLNILSFIVCVYITTFLRKHFYYLSSSTSRIQIVIILTVVNILVQYVINVFYTSIEFSQVLAYVVLPEVWITAVAAVYVFPKLKDFVLKFTL